MYEFRFLPEVQQKVRDFVEQGVFKNENRAYVFLAHHELGTDSEDRVQR